MIIKTEQAMLDFAEAFAKQLTFPAVLALSGDVGAGKTTFTRGLAKGLGVTEPVTSPSFTISKTYSFPVKSMPITSIPHLSAPTLSSSLAASAAESVSATESASAAEPASAAYGRLSHYDFYRLDDPGIMVDDLAEAVALPNSVTVIEWGQDVEQILPADALHLNFTINPDDSRKLEITSHFDPDDSRKLEIANRLGTNDSQASKTPESLSSDNRHIPNSTKSSGVSQRNITSEENP